MNDIEAEEFIKNLKEVFEYMKNKSVERVGTKEKPLYCMVSNKCYLETKNQKLIDENDMYRMPTGEWVKIINVENPVKQEPKLHAVEKSGNPFCNAYKQPFYKPLFVKDKSMYALKVQGKWRNK